MLRAEIASTAMPGTFATDADPYTTAPTEFVAHPSSLEQQGADDLLNMIFEEWTNNGITGPLLSPRQAPGQHLIGNQQQAKNVTMQPPAQPNPPFTFTAAATTREQNVKSVGPSATCSDTQQRHSYEASGSGGAPIGSASSAGASCGTGRKNAGRSSQQQHEDNAAPAKASRWKQSKTKMNSLEAKAAEAKALADKMEDENLALRMRALAMEHTVAAREKQVSILSDHHVRRSSLGSAASGGSNYSSAGNPAQCDLATVPVSVLAGKLRRFIGEASMLLLQVTDARSADVAQQAVQTLAHMVGEFCTEMGSVFVLNTQTQFQILTCRIDQPDAGPSTPQPGHWDMVVAQLQVTPNQLLEVAACWDLNGMTMTKLQTEVESLRNQLSAAVSIGNTTLTSELQQRLSTALLNQALACRAMAFILFGRILTPVQTAQAIVHSFPYFPNARELISRLLVLRGAMS